MIRILDSFHCFPERSPFDVRYTFKRFQGLLPLANSVPPKYEF